MKLSLFTLVHVLALLLAYAALGIVLYQWFKVDLPLSESIKTSNFLSIGAFVLLPILGFACIR